jgi:hypothetical protein
VGGIQGDVITDAGQKNSAACIKVFGCVVYGLRGRAKPEKRDIRPGIGRQFRHLEDHGFHFVLSADLNKYFHGNLRLC